MVGVVAISRAVLILLPPSIVDVILIVIVRCPVTVVAVAVAAVVVAVIPIISRTLQ